MSRLLMPMLMERSRILAAQPEGPPSGVRRWWWWRRRRVTLSVCPGVASTLFLVMRERIERIENGRMCVRVGVGFWWRAMMNVVGLDPP
jgi:hypothetical protein